MGSRSLRSEHIKYQVNIRDGLDLVERIDGLDTKFVDWHVKYTLYKVKYQTDKLVSNVNIKYSTVTFCEAKLAGPPVVESETFSV